MASHKQTVRIIPWFGSWYERMKKFKLNNYGTLSRHISKGHFIIFNKIINLYSIEGTNPTLQLRQWVGVSPLNLEGAYKKILNRAIPNHKSFFIVQRLARVNINIAFLFLHHQLAVKSHTILTNNNWSFIHFDSTSKSQVTRNKTKIILQREISFLLLCFVPRIMKISHNTYHVKS